MKGKNLSKVLAFLLAAVMIFSALPLMAFASDEAATYTVSYGAPAIPMNEMTIVNLADISVEMEKGTVVSGADITWAAEAQTGIEFNADAKTVTAFSKGIYKLTATAGDLSKTIYVMVKKAEETEFYLVNFESLNINNFVADDWFSFPQKGTSISYDASKLIDASLSNSASIRTAHGACIVYKDEIFKDFADYTVKILAKTTITTSSGGMGAAARIKVSDDGTLFTNGIVTTFRTAGNIGVRKPSAPTSSYAQFGTTVAHWTDKEEHTITTTFNGSTAVFNYDDIHIVNTSDYSAYPAANELNAGYPGIVSYDDRGTVKSFQVYLNSNTLAPATAYVDTSYVVTAASPAIPMNENTKVNLADLTFEIGGKKVKGAAVELTLDNATDDVVVESASITAYAKGVYPATVKYGEATTKVYIVVKTAAETEWVLYDKTFEKEVLPEDWTVQTYLNKVYSDKITTVYPDVPNPNPGFTPVRVHETNDNYLWSTHGFFTLNNEVVSSFADYTIDVNATFFGHIHGTGYIYGRTNTTNGLLTLDSELQGFEIDNRNDYGIPYYTVFHNTGKNRTKIYEGTDWTVSKTVANQQYQMTQDNFVVKFAGDTLSVYEADDKTEAHTFTATGITQKPGTVGIAAFILGQGGDAKSAGGWTKIEDIKITLNNTADDMPISEAVEPKPEEPKPTINITGEGTAAVEAVVGSENNYTVELAPAVGYKVKVGSLVIDGKAVILGAEGDTTGRLYTFTSENLNATTISVEYIPDDGTFNSMMLGATIPVNPEKKGIRFGARTDFIRRNGETGLLGDKLLVDGVVYEPTEVGMLFIPSALIDGELTVNTERATRQAVSKVVKLTGDFSDIAITLVGIPESFFGVKISSRMYVAYEVDGETKYVYTEVIERSYNDVVAAIGK